jgi:hypothetical protein
VARKVVYKVKIATPTNGRFRKSTIFARDAEDNDRATDKGDMEKVSERRRVAAEFARLLGGTAERWEKTIEDEWRKILEDNSRFRKQAAAGSPEAAPLEEVCILDAMPPAIRRPLALVGEYAYAAAWMPVERKIHRGQDAKTGAVTNYDPPLVQTETSLLIIRSDGLAFSESAMPDVQPLTKLGLAVHLSSPLPPGREWSGAGHRGQRSSQPIRTCATAAWNKSYSLPLADKEPRDEILVAGCGRPQQRLHEPRSGTPYAPASRIRHRHPLSRNP